ncbi:App1 family protein [Microlunatus panaciterrae]
MIPENLQRGDLPDEEAASRASRIDDAINNFRERRARRRGRRPTVIGYVGYGSTSWVRVLGRVLIASESKLIKITEDRDDYQRIRGWRSFTSVPVESARVTVEIAGRTTEVVADRGGVIDAKVDVRLSPGWHTVGLRTEDSDTVRAWVFIVDPEVRFGVVSDIDDTVMVTALPRPLLAAWNTFVLNEHARTPTPGIAVLYERISAANPRSPVIYLSTGAWNVAPTLTRFLSRNLYPAGALLLTDWGPTRNRLFRSGPEHKRANLERLAEEFPQIRWLLIGDDGQHDEAIYADFARHHPDNVAAVCIRQLSPGEAVLAGSTGRAHGPDQTPGVRWFYASDGAGLAEQLVAADLMPAESRQPEI